MSRRRPVAVVTAFVVAALAAVAVAALAAGCGKSDDAKVRDTLARFQQATAKHDFRTLCDDVFASELVRRVRATGLACPIALQRSVISSTLQPSIDVEKVRVRGNTALALVTTTAVGQRPSQDTIRLVKEGDGWRIASLSGAQPPSPPRDLEGNPQESSG